MFLRRFFARKVDISQDLYEAIVAAARQEKFYGEWGVPDTVDGRFDMIILHVFLVLDRLKSGGAATLDLRQSLTDSFFRDMDRSLREMGVGDLSVGKKVRKMAEAFYGRVAAYAGALDASGDVSDVIRRNIFPDGSNKDVSALATWVKVARAHLSTQDVTKGEVIFP